MPKHAVRSITNAVDNMVLPRHRWYPIKEGFSASLITDALSEVDHTPRNGIFAIEPFSGSGTSPLQYALSGVECLAFEVNPFLAFVGQAKLEQSTPRILSNAFEWTVKGIRQPLKTSLESYSTFSQAGGKSKWLFNRSVLRSFMGGWDSTKRFARPERSLSRLALMKAAMDNCNAYPDGKCLRYKRMDNYRSFNASSFLSAYEAYIAMMKEDVVAAPISGSKSSVERMDARRLSTHRDIRKFDLCVTSPPYLNSFDYTDVYRPELFLGGFVRTNADLMNIRLQTVRSHVQAAWAKPFNDDFGINYAKAYKELVVRKEQLWNPNIPNMIQAYFEDMAGLLKNLRNRAKPDAVLKIAVGTSAYAGVVIPVDFILADIAEKVGWLTQEVQVIRRLRSSGQHWNHEAHSTEVPALRESIVVLKADGQTY
ncbi:MAG: hypothetical protein IPI00_02805 [Flavobacteriales bacterium]|nr:hypothetical protein [Flavobacteriales bacterium]MBK6945952.1 hypothetical protein [Flavobacteriales bacterium]MBK7239111.1 hypothetical protein [Flavobacteriales bacterium]MBK9536783.1 hypothetical protein [Flavobacteriales bacterium]MBP9138262.1 hypothetical protein [Flavobacteriales bacterium]